jgi:Cytochrome P450
VRTCLKIFDAVLTPFPKILEKLPMPANRRTAAVDRGDLLSMLLLAQDHEVDGTGKTDEQVRDEALTLFLARHETTANALTWTWYLLAVNSEAETKLDFIQFPARLAWRDLGKSSSGT